MEDVSPTINNPRPVNIPKVTYSNKKGSHTDRQSFDGRKLVGKVKYDDSNFASLEEDDEDPVLSQSN